MRKEFSRKHFFSLEARSPISVLDQRRFVNKRGWVKFFIIFFSQHLFREEAGAPTIVQKSNGQMGNMQSSHGEQWLGCCHDLGAGLERPLCLLNWKFTTSFSTWAVSFQFILLACCRLADWCLAECSCITNKIFNS
jgi:hypothetical protein